MNSFNQLLDQSISESHILATVKAFLVSCQWQIEVNEKLISIPENCEIKVLTRAYISAGEGVFLGDHFESVVILGSPPDQPASAELGYLRLYFNLQGQFVSEDRWQQGESSMRLGIQTR
ncbi:MAG: hypothetical protein RL095_4015 [Verrucomicrobiota bacterium]